MRETEEFLLLDAIENNKLRGEEQDLAFLALSGNVNAQKEILPTLNARAIVGYNPNDNADLFAFADDSQDKDFDYKKGADGRLRALMSFGEKPSEREGILQKIVGKDGYTKDSKGRLALTPKGQQVRGMEVSDKNIIIEDKGFSARDFADLAGILPETIGAVAGGILGAPGLFTGAAGAAAGAAAGQAVEEGIESLLGVQKQTLPEVAKDVAKEAALAGTLDLVTVGIFRAGRNALGLAAKQTGPGGTADPQRALRLMEDDFIPSIDASGGPGAIGYAQKFASGAKKDVSRILANTDAAMKKVNKIKEEAFGADASLDVGVDAFSAAAKAKVKTTQADLKAAETSSMNAVKDSINLIQKSVADAADIDTEAINAIQKAFSSFNDTALQKWKALDDKLEGIQIKGADGIVRSGQDAFAVPIQPMLNEIDNIRVGVGSLEVLGADVNRAIRGIQDLASNSLARNPDAPLTASFQQIARQRKLINDTLFSANYGSELAQDLYKLRDSFDYVLSAKNIDIKTTGLPKETVRQLKDAIKLRDSAKIFYKEGMDTFDELSDMGVVREIAELRAGNVKNYRVDNLFTKIIRPNEPGRLQNVLDFVSKNSAKKINQDTTKVLGKKGGEAVAEDFRAKLARAYLENSMKKTSVDLLNPEKFTGVAFKTQIDKLGGTGKVLFGDSWPKVQQLADTIAQYGPTKMSQESVDNIAKINVDKPLVEMIENLAEARRANDAVMKSNLMQKLSRGELDAEEVLDTLASPNVSRENVNVILKTFEGDVAAKTGLQQSVVERILSSVGEDVFTSPSAAQNLKRQLQKYNQSSLKKILGDETYNNINQFADDLVFLGDVGKEGSIVAAGIVAHPIGRLKDNVRLTATASFLNRPGVAKFFAERAVGKNPQNRFTATMDGIGRVAGATVGAMNVIRQAGVRAGIEQGEQTGTEIKRQLGIPVEKPLLSTPIPNISSPMAQIDVTQPTTNLRQQAKQNPGVAQTLGIQGATQGLL